MQQYQKLFMILFLILFAVIFCLFFRHATFKSTIGSVELIGWLFPVYKENKRVNAIFVCLSLPSTHWEGKKEIYTEPELKKLLGQTTIFPKTTNSSISAKDAIEVAKKTYGEGIANITEPLLVYGLNGPYYYTVSVTGEKGPHTYGISASTGEFLWGVRRIVNFPNYETSLQKALTFLKQEQMEGEITEGYLVDYWILPSGLLVSNETTRGPLPTLPKFPPS
jgi:hypothetical protein